MKIKFFIFLLMLGNLFTQEEKKEEPYFKLPEVTIIGEEQIKTKNIDKEMLNIDFFTENNKPYLILDKSYIDEFKLYSKESPIKTIKKMDSSFTEIIANFGSFDTLGTKISTGREKKDYSYLFDIFGKKNDGFEPNYGYGILDTNCILRFQQTKNIFFKTSCFFKNEQIPEKYKSNNKINVNIGIDIDETLPKDILLHIFLNGEFAGYTQIYSQIFDLPSATKFSAFTALNTFFPGSNIFKVIVDFEAEGIKRREYSTLSIKKLPAIQDVYVLNKILIEELLPTSNKDIQLNLGLVCDHNWGNISVIVPKADLIYTPLKNFKVKLGFEPHLTMPSFTELYIKSDYIEPPFDEKFSPIEKESINFRLEMNYKINEEVELENKMFLRRFKNFIYLEDTDDNNLFEPHNLENVDETFGKIMVKCPVYKKVNQETYFSFRNLENKDVEIIPCIPVYKLGTKFSYEFDDFSLFVAGNYVDKLYTDQNKKNLINSYFVINLGGSKNIKKGIEIFVVINNILNKKYKNELGFFEPGTNFSLSGKFKFQ